MKTVNLSGNTLEEVYLDWLNTISDMLNTVVPGEDCLSMFVPLSEDETVGFLHTTFRTICVLSAVDCGYSARAIHGVNCDLLSIWITHREKTKDLARRIKVESSAVWKDKIQVSKQEGIH